MKLVRISLQFVLFLAVSRLPSSSGANRKHQNGVDHPDGEPQLVTDQRQQQRALHQQHASAHGVAC